MAGNKQGPGIKTVDIDEIAEFVAEAMGARKKKHAIKAELEDMLGDEISSYAYERLRQRARFLITERSGRTQETHRGNAIEFYESILAGDSVTKDKINAQTRLDNILGLEKQFTPFSALQLAEDVKTALKEIDDVTDGEVVSAETASGSDSISTEQEKV